MEFSPLIITFKTAIVATVITFFTEIFLAYFVSAYSRGIFFIADIRQARRRRKIFTSIRREFSFHLASGSWRTNAVDVPHNFGSI